MAVLDNSQSITALYAAAFGRAPDKAGLAYWNEQMATGATFADVITGFLSSAEAASLVGQAVNDQMFLSNLYGNTLGRTADVSGGEYWKGRLDSLESRTELVKEFIFSLNNGAGSDTKLLQNKIEIGQKFAASASGNNLIYAKSIYTYVTSDTVALDVAKSLNEAFDNPTLSTGPVVPPLITPTLGAPTIALHADTGLSALDGVTSNGTIDVLLPSGADSWQYSTDTGANWLTGSGNAFVLPENTYATGDVLVKYLNGTGDVSFNATFAGSVVIDQTGPKFDSIASSTTVVNSSFPFPGQETVSRMLISYDENVYASTVDMVFFNFTGSTGSDIFHNKGVIAGALAIDAERSMAGLGVDVILPVGIVTDLAGNQSQALGASAGITFQLI